MGVVSSAITHLSVGLSMHIRRLFGWTLMSQTQLRSFDPNENRKLQNGIQLMQARVQTLRAEIDGHTHNMNLHATTAKGQLVRIAALEKLKRAGDPTAAVRLLAEKRIWKDAWTKQEKLNKKIQACTTEIAVWSQHEDSISDTISKAQALRQQMEIEQSLRSCGIANPMSQLSLLETGRTVTAGMMQRNINAQAMAELAGDANDMTAEDLEESSVDLDKILEQELKTMLPGDDVSTAAIGTSLSSATTTSATHTINFARLDPSAGASASASLLPQKPSILIDESAEDDDMQVGHNLL